MELPVFFLLAFDAASHALLLVDGPSGAIREEFPIPAGFTPCGLVTNQEHTIAYIPTVNYDDSGALFIVKIRQGTSYRLPVPLPHPAQFALSPDACRAFIANPAGELFHLDLTTLAVASWGTPGADARCSGLTADWNCLYSVWEQQNKGLLAVFNHSGNLVEDYCLSGQPTSLQFGAGGRLLIPFTTETAGDEGLEIRTTSCLAQTQVIPVHTRTNCEHPQAFPLYATLSQDGGTAYVVNEDNADISVLNLAASKVCSLIPTGRSLSTLYLLPNERFAVAGSNMFADLTLIDLVNERILSMTDTSRELLSYLAVLPG